MRLLGRAAALACCLVCLHLVFRTDTLKEFGVSADVWDQAGAYRERGMAGAFVSNLKYLNVEVPEGYSPERADELLMAAQAAERSRRRRAIHMRVTPQPGHSSPVSA